MLSGGGEWRKQRVARWEGGVAAGGHSVWIMVRNLTHLGSVIIVLLRVVDTKVATAATCTDQQDN